MPTLDVVFSRFLSTDDHLQKKSHSSKLSLLIFGFVVFVSLYLQGKEGIVVVHGN